MNVSAVKDWRTAMDFSIALGAGYGRMFDIGARLRVSRIETVLRNNHVLGRPFDQALALQLQQLWWAQRNSRTSHNQLIATIRALRSAGALLTEPDATEQRRSETPNASRVPGVTVAMCTDGSAPTATG